MSFGDDTLDPSPYDFATHFEAKAAEINRDNVAAKWWADEDELLEALKQLDGMVERKTIRDLRNRLILWNTLVKLMLTTCELAEGVESLRAGDPPSDHVPEFSGLTEELADAHIRLLDLGYRRGLPVGRCIEAKLAFNKTRPHKHGGKAV